MKLSVYLIHWQAPDWIVSAVESFSATLDVELSITIIDNGGLTEEARGELTRDRDVRIVEMPCNLGYATAANVGLRDWFQRTDVDDDYCIIGSHDLHVAPWTVAHLLETMRGDEGLGIVGPILYRPNWWGGGVWRRNRSRQVRFETISWSESVSGDPMFPYRECDWVSGTCLLLRRRCVQDVGWFDERLGSYSEDVDYCLRAVLRGWKVGVSLTGIVCGLGSRAVNHSVLIAANRVLMAAKYGGEVATVRSVWKELVRPMLRSGRRALAPWRDAEERGRAQRRLGQHWRATLQLAKKSKVLWSMLGDGRRLSRMPPQRRIE